MKTNNNIPDYRFQGYTDAWELRKLRDTVIEIIAGGDIDKNKVVEFGKYPIYANSHSGDGIVGYYDDFYRVNGPAVTVTGRGEVGFAKARETDFTPVVRLLAIRSKHNHYFLENAINLHGVTVESTGVPQLTVPQLSAYRIYFPYDIQEENQIGTFFSTLDRQITLHQRKLDTLKEQKKTYLKLLFPAKGQTQPALRFQGFEDDWEEVKLGEVVEKSGSGGTPKSTNKAYYGGNIPFLSITDITQSGKYITNTEKTLTEIGLENSSAWKVPKGAISLAMYASVGKLAILKTDVATSQAFFNMVFSNEIVRDYVYFILDKAQLFNEWLPLISTGTQGNLNAQK
ncbi:TPA: restriction endonuclease subunit S, partial [Streptococcus suis]|nr:restriction endonuclease subunit S [Streptococcus suis]